MDNPQQILRNLQGSALSLVETNGGHSYHGSVLKVSYTGGIPDRRNPYKYFEPVSSEWIEITKEQAIEILRIY